MIEISDASAKNVGMTPSPRYAFVAVVAMGASVGRNEEIN